MISFLVGNVAEKTPPLIVIEAAGVGYEVQASLNTFSSLPKIGSQVKILIHFIVREDAQLLFGFADEAERKMFRALIKVNGVGPKLAMAILSGMDAGTFGRCVIANDIKTLVQLPGVGKKTAERLIVEMKDRLQEWQQQALNTATGDAQNDTALSGNVMLADAERALITLGYKPTEASKVMAKLDISAISSTEQAIRAALQAMLQRK